MKQNKIELAKNYEALARKLRAEAHAERKLPKVWKVGQKIRFLNDSEWAWNKGNEWYIVALRDDECLERPANEYQVFYTSPKWPFNQKYGMFWTTPNDVELVEDVNEKSAQN